MGCPSQERGGKVKSDEKTTWSLQIYSIYAVHTFIDMTSAYMEAYLHILHWINSGLHAQISLDEIRCTKADF
jgi:hypothetical protein